MSPSESILVLGVGELGMPVLRGLAHHPARAGAAVTVLLRPPAPGSQSPSRERDLAELSALGVRFVFADLASDPVEKLAELFQSYTTVIGCTGFGAGRQIQLKLTRAALRAGVARYLPWQFGVDYDLIGRGSPQDLFDEQLDVRDLLRSQDRTDWLILSTGMFTSFLFEPSFGVVDLEHGAVHALGSWTNAVTVTTPEDIGKLTAAAVYARPRLRNQILYTAGDTLTYAQLADLVDQVLGRPARRQIWTLDRLAAELGQDPADPLKKYRLVFAQGRGVAWDPAATFNVAQGIPTQSAQQWLSAQSPEKTQQTSVPPGAPLRA